MATPSLCSSSPLPSLDDLVLLPHVDSERLAREERNEALAHRLVLGAMQERDVALSQDVLGRGVQLHEQRVGAVVVEHMAAERGIRHEEREDADNAAEGVIIVG